MTSTTRDREPERRLCDHITAQTCIDKLATRFYNHAMKSTRKTRTATAAPEAAPRGRPPGLRRRPLAYSQRFFPEELAAFRYCAQLSGDSMAAWVRRHLRAAAIKDSGRKDLFRPRCAAANYAAETSDSAT